MGKINVDFALLLSNLKKKNYAFRLKVWFYYSVRSFKNGA